MKITFEIQFEIIDENLIKQIEKGELTEDNIPVVEKIIEKINNDWGTECDDLSIFNFCHFESFFDVYADTEEELDKLEDKVKQYLNNLDKEYEDILEINYYVSDRSLEEEKD